MFYFSVRDDRDAKFSSGFIVEGEENRCSISESRGAVAARVSSDQVQHFPGEINNSILLTLSYTSKACRVGRSCLGDL